MAMAEAAVVAVAAAMAVAVVAAIAQAVGVGPRVVVIETTAEPAAQALARAAFARWPDVEEAAAAAAVMAAEAGWSQWGKHDRLEP